MPAKQYFAKRRAKMMMKHPYCYWCGIRVVHHKLNPHQRMPDNFATIDHLISKYYGKRPNVYGKEKTLVLACNKCNFERCKKETESLPRWKLWFKSKSFPRYLFFMKWFVRSNRKSKNEKSINQRTVSTKEQGNLLVPNE